MRLFKDKNIEEEVNYKEKFERLIRELRNELRNCGKSNTIPIRLIKYIIEKHE